MWTSCFDVATQGELNIHCGHSMIDRLGSVVTFSSHDDLNFWLFSGMIRASPLQLVTGIDPVLSLASQRHDVFLKELILSAKRRKLHHYKPGASAGGAADRVAVYHPHLSIVSEYFVSYDCFCFLDSW